MDSLLVVYEKYLKQQLLTYPDYVFGLQGSVSQFGHPVQSSDILPFTLKIKKIPEKNNFPIFLNVFQLKNGGYIVFRTQCMLSYSYLLSICFLNEIRLRLKRLKTNGVRTHHPRIQGRHSATNSTATRVKTVRIEGHRETVALQRTLSTKSCRGGGVGGYSPVNQ